MDRDFLWRVEMACRDAWPVEEEINIDGWIARRSGGLIRRANSLNPLPGASPLDDAIIDQAEAHYARFGQPSIVRFPSIAGDAGEEALARRGYKVNGLTTTLYARIARTAQPRRIGPARSIVVSGRPGRTWLAARSRIAGADKLIFERMLERLEGPALYAGARIDGCIQSVAYGAIVDELLVVESVATAEAHRGKGYARKVVQSLMDWAAAQGVREAVLQVVTDNAPARALYSSLGFKTELFDYFYMRQPGFRAPDH